MDKPVKTISFGFNEASDELPYARIVADHFKTDHKEYIVNFDHLEETLPEIVWYMEEPISNGSIIPTYYYLKVIKEDTTVTLIGEGADELFAGYKRFKYMSPFLGFIPQGLKDYASLSNIGHFSDRQKRRLFTEDLRRRMNGHDPLEHYYKYFKNKKINLITVSLLT